jgi:MFS family permease
MYFYSDFLSLYKEKFYSKFASSCALIYSIRFLDFTIIAWLLTNISDNPASIGALVFVKFIPMMFSGLITGWLVDKFSRLAIIKFVIISHSIYLM